MSTSSRSDFESPAVESAEVNHTSRTILPTAPLPEPIGRNIEAIVALHTSAERSVPRHQRTVEAASDFFGRPAFLYSILLLAALWMLLNVLPQRFGLLQFDPPPFTWLEFSLSLGSLLTTTGVLIKQNRQEKLAEQRAQLGLQLNLLSEQKVAKLIALIEELRRDLPIVQDRYDPEVEVLKQAADPHVVMDTLEERLAEELAELQKRETSS